MNLRLESDIYKIKLDNFEGPLDLLCHLIEKNKMNIYDISINDITDQYLDYINSMKKMNLEITGEFIIMASNLLYIKSGLLLPANSKDDDEIVDSREELIARLIEYKKIKEITEVLKKKNEEYSLFHYKEPEIIEFAKDKPRLEAGYYTSEMLSETFLKLAKANMDKINHNAKDIERLAISERITVRSKIKELLRGLLKKGKVVFNKMFNVKEKSKVEVITAFMAMLELNKASKILIEQDYTFGDIKLTKL